MSTTIPVQSTVRPIRHSHCQKYRYTTKSIMPLPCRAQRSHWTLIGLALDAVRTAAQALQHPFLLSVMEPDYTPHNLLCHSGYLHRKEAATARAPPATDREIGTLLYYLRNGDWTECTFRHPLHIGLNLPPFPATNENNSRFIRKIVSAAIHKRHGHNSSAICNSWVYT